MPKSSKPRLVNRGAAGLRTKVQRDDQGNITNKPKLTNRGGAGLLNRKKAGGKDGAGNGTTETVGKSPEQQVLETPAPINNICASLKKTAMPIDSLTLDPRNARVHPERNLETIKASLVLYGQLKPIVVRKDTNVVVAGNGTLTAAKALGWTKIAVTMADLTETQALGYGITDNRSAELARWDLEGLADLEKLLNDINHPLPGWSRDELDVMRAADFTPPEVDDNPFGGGGRGGGWSKGGDRIKFTAEQRDVIDRAVALVREKLGEEDLDESICLWTICREYLGEGEDEDGEGIEEDQE